MKYSCSYLSMILVAVALSGCTTVIAANTAVKNASESKQLDKLCKLRPLVYQAAILVGAQIEIPTNIWDNINKANIGLKTLCDDRPSNIVEALKTATALYNQLLDSNSTVALVATTAIAKAN